MGGGPPNLEKPKRKRLAFKTRCCILKRFPCQIGPSDIMVKASYNLSFPENEQCKLIIVKAMASYATEERIRKEVAKQMFGDNGASYFFEDD